MSVRFFSVYFFALLSSLLLSSLSAADYLVVDLSAGSNAGSYPVSYMGSPPAGGWTDEYKTSKLVLRRIPSGTFVMGSPESEPGRYDNEGQHEVTLTEDYLMGVFEVTQRQWELVMGDRPSYFNNNNYYTKRPVEKVSYVDIREAGSNDPNVSWPQNTNVTASSFVGRLRARTGINGLDLPTEAQWEYACRAGTTSAFNSGLGMASTYSAPTMDGLGRYKNNNASDATAGSNDSSGTAAAGSYAPNDWGLYDMHGNVWEICVDLYADDYGPDNAVDPLGAPSGSNMNMKGGGYVSNARNFRSARRRDNRSITVASRDYGFRLASHTIPAGMVAIDLDDDGYRAVLPTDDPLYDPDDSAPYVPFVDLNGNFVPDNFGNDAASPLADHSPKMDYRRTDGSGVTTLRLSVGFEYQVLRSTNLSSWEPVAVEIDGQWTTTFASDTVSEVTDVAIEEEGLPAAFYLLEATTTPAR